MARPEPCPCGRGLPYAECCGPAHEGTPPATAEALMRSRYSAYARDDTAYLLHSWHPETRPVRIEADPHLRWAGLEVLAATGGGLFDAEGVVEFRARYRERGRPGEMRERSRFVRHDGRWVYWGPLQPVSYRRRGPAASSSGSGMSSGNTDRDTRSSDG